MKAKHLTSILGLLCALSLTGCGNKKSGDDDQKSGGDVKPASEQKIEVFPINPNIEISKEYFAVTPLTLDLLVDEHKSIDVSAIPASYSGDNLKFVSRDTSIVEVSNSGVATGKAKGVTYIDVSTSDNQAKESIIVTVNEELEKTEGANRLKAKGEAYRDPSYVKASKIWAHEYVEQTLTKNGKDISKQGYVEEIIFDKEEAYFEVSSEDIEIRTIDGATSISNGKWIFYVDQESYYTFLIHETETSKNYMKVATQSYLGREPYEIIYDVLDMFFVSGSSIVTNYLDDVDGVDYYDTDDTNYIDCLLNDYSNAQASAYAPNDDDVFVKLAIQMSDQEMKPAEELSIDIPAGTKYEDDTTVDLLVHEEHVYGTNIESVMTFELDEVPYVRSFKKQIQYIRDFTVSIPSDLSQYGEVDSIYDL